MQVDRGYIEDLLTVGTFKGGRSSFGTSRNLISFRRGWESSIKVLKWITKIKINNRKLGTGKLDINGILQETLNDKCRKRACLFLFSAP